MKNENQKPAPPKPITLIATIGSSPAVLTEALYELHRQGKWPVTEIVLLTTSHGVKRINNDLFVNSSGRKGGFYMLCEELGIAPNSIDVPVGDKLEPVRSKEGEPLEDIRTRKDDQVMAGRIQQVVSEKCKMHDRRVFALLAGGRKTMSAHLFSAMQLFAREQDRLIHILVSEPFENITDFYFPVISRPLMLEHKTLTGESMGTYDASKASIDLIDIPFIKLRTFLEKNTDLNFSLPYDDLLAEIDTKLKDAMTYPVRSLVIDLPNSCICINGAENTIHMEPRALSILAFCGLLNILEGRPRDVAWGEVIENSDYLYLLHIIYRAIKLPLMENVNEEYRNMNYQEFEKDDNWAKWDYWHDENRKPRKRDFPKQRSNLVSSIAGGLDTPALKPIKLAHVFHFKDHNRHNNALRKVHQIPVPVSNIKILGLDIDEAKDIFQDSE